MSDEQIEKRLIQLRETAGKYAKAYAQKEFLEDYKNSKLAILMKKYEAEGAKTSAAQERDARADPDYIALLEGLKVAVEESERLRWEMKLAEVAIDIWRTRQASQRAERKGYGA